MTLPDPNTTPGRWLVSPIELMWYEKGYFWATQMRWDRHFVIRRKRPKFGEAPAVREGEKTVWYETYWVEEKVELINLGVKNFDQDAPCRCAECIGGRDEVHSGWKPAIDEYGYAKRAA